VTLPVLVPFGPMHVGALAAAPVAALGLAVLVRRHPSLERPVRLLVAAALAGNQLAYLVVAIRRGWVDPPRGLPLELCDVAVWCAVAALAGGPAWFGEVLWFTALAGSTQALLTPDLGVPWPSYPAVKFLLGHAGTVAAALFLAACGRLRPRRGAWWRVLLLVDLYAASMLALDLSTGTNYLYLRAKPPRPSILDWLGPWPFYLLWAEALAAGAFFLLELPSRFRRRC